MSKAQKTQLTFRVWYQGSNMPGYMPDEPPHPFPTEEAARESLAWDIGRDIDLRDESDETSYQYECIAELERYRACVLSGDAGDATIGNRHYFIHEDTATTDELEYLDVDDLTEFEPILDEWIDVETLDALESADFDVEIDTVRHRYMADAPTHDRKGDDIVDDYGSGGNWYVGKMACGYSVLPHKIVRAATWHDAWEAFIDSCQTVPTDELHDAYDMTAEEFAAACDRMDAQRQAGEDIDYPELAEGYQHQSNATDTGIVDTSDLTMDEAGDEWDTITFKVRIAE